MNKKHTAQRATAVLGLVLGLNASVAHAQFGNLLQQLQKIQAPAGGQPAAPGGLAAGSGASAGGAKKNGLAPSDQWCKEQSGALGSMKVNTGLIASEFKIENLESLQDDFSKAFARTNISRTFPDVRFFQRSFETKKVRAIFDTFIAFPEPDTLAALIQLSRGSDQQERGDALMALAYLNLQAPNLAVKPTRWAELYQGALSTNHYSAVVFRARQSTYGEQGPKNIGAALGYLVQAGNMPAQYKRGDGGTMEFDTQNYQTVHTATVKDIFVNEPNMPYRQQWEAPAKTALQIEASQLAYANRFGSTRIGKVYKDADRINQASIDIGNQIISKSQGGNQLAGQIAGLQSLKSNKAGDKQVFIDMSPEVQSAQLRMISKLDALDPEQKKLLVQAQEMRYTAQGMITQSYGELLNDMLANMGSGDMVKMATPLESLKQANNALIQSCMITAKWEQAMRAKDLPVVDKKKAAAEVVATTSKYTDD